jgi:hypothetical protein
VAVAAMSHFHTHFFSLPIDMVMAAGTAATIYHLLGLLVGVLDL